MRLQQWLVDHGIPAEQVDAACRGCATDDPVAVGEALLKAGVVSEQQLLQAWGDFYGVPVWSQVSEGALDPSLVANVPVEWSRMHKMLPVRDGEKIMIVAASPAAFRHMDQLCLVLGQDLGLILAPSREIERAIDRCYFKGHSSARGWLGSYPEAPTSVTASSPSTEDLLRAAENAPVTQFVNSLLLDALRMDASDIHIEPLEKNLRIRFRIDGVLYEQATPPKQLQASLVSRLKVMAHLDIAEKRLPQDGAARVRVGDREIDIRVSTIPVPDGERVVLRLLNRESALLPLGSLGMSAEILEHFRAAIQAPHGMILVTGPTGSGKTTTLYAALRELDTAHRNILTVEDPIEYQLPDIGQMQVQPRIGLTFSNCLRHILRQDPDVILVGETRDLETAEIAIRAALTGHLVFTTLHTNDATSAVIRLTDMGIPAYLLSAALRAALAQRLVRRLCSHCRRPATAIPEEIAALGALVDKLRGSVLMQPVGCANCFGGFRGRTGLFEFFAVDSEIAEMIRQNTPVAELRSKAVEKGMVTLLEDGLRRVAAGETSLNEVLRAVGVLGPIS